LYFEKLGSQAANGGLDEERLLVSLRVDDKVYSSTGKSGFFEDELLALQKAARVNDPETHAHGI
jgi:hypothetical protein